ncbi:hypothetical protein [Thiohalobacter thiocyanaticus]|uniref:hypothetical protein n=1 Tax=Thiohalobacter thiocyanaticus TaxID=585455 RepID=UPI000F633CA4|nr:hypothetical protein [Thiohalobacter thiocyanaticus]
MELAAAAADSCSVWAAADRRRPGAAGAGARGPYIVYRGGVPGHDQLAALQVEDPARPGWTNALARRHASPVRKNSAW